MKLKTLFKSGIGRKVLVATALSAFAITAAFALQVDQTRIMSKRLYATHQPSYYRLTINYNDPNISTAQAFGALGVNTFIKAIDCHVTTAFNASTTNVILLGTSTASTNEISASGTITPGSTGVQHLTTAVGLGLGATSAADVTLYAKYTQTGNGSPSAGSVTCVLEYVPNDDL
jgi:hypothetical protein